MNLNEVSQPSDKKLFEEIDPTNTTGYSTEDLIKVVRVGEQQWSQPMELDRLMKWLGI